MADAQRGGAVCRCDLLRGERAGSSERIGRHAAAADLLRGARSENVFHFIRRGMGRRQSAAVDFKPNFGIMLSSFCPVSSIESVLLKNCGEFLKKAANT